MIALIEALNYRCLKYVRQELNGFQVLVGPNASGKSTFLDVVAFLGDLLRDGPEAAVLKRSSRIEELVWKQEGSRFELAVELVIPKPQGDVAKQHSICRYEVAVGTDEESDQVRVLAETLWLHQRSHRTPKPQRSLFPQEPDAPKTILFGSAKTPLGWRTVVKKVQDSGNDYFKSETTDWNNSFRIGPTKAALANLPEDATKFPDATWAKRFLMEGIHTLALNSATMRRPSGPGMGRVFRPDGSNLPYLIKRLRKTDQHRFEAWIEHLRTAFPNLSTIKVRERPEDRHLYLTIADKLGMRVPSWLVSDGTLRLLALTLLAYIQQPGVAYLIEEPENGIHPLAVQTVFQSLSSAYESQVLVASHSPVFLSLAESNQILCFSRTAGGATDIVNGAEHPKLKDWKGEVALSDLFAAGVLG
jgi:predicted ATPase